LAIGLGLSWNAKPWDLTIGEIPRILLIFADPPMPSFAICSSKLGLAEPPLLLPFLGILGFFMATFELLTIWVSPMMRLSGFDPIYGPLVAGLSFSLKLFLGFFWEYFWI
jgi:hypothetical protein